MARKVHLSYGSRRFVAYDCWTQSSVAGNAATADSNKSRCEKKHAMWKLKRNIADNKFYSLYGVKRNTAANEAHFWDCCSNVGHFLCGVARVKRYLNVYLRLYRQQPEIDNQNVDFAYHGKIFADAHACVICVDNLTSALYFAI